MEEGKGKAEKGGIREEEEEKERERERERERRGASIPFYIGLAPPSYCQVTVGVKSRQNTRSLRRCPV